jgi:predicted metal-dependent enzyme (double-stranded beta helix superfamily)
MLIAATSQVEFKPDKIFKIKNSNSRTTAKLHVYTVDVTFLDKRCLHVILEEK